MTRSTNHKMFWRLLSRSLFVKRPQASLAVGSLLVGAAICSMLVNLYDDARRKMTQEFRGYGPNIVLLPRGEPPKEAFGVANLMPEGNLDGLERVRNRWPGLTAVPVLYGVVRLRKVSTDRTQNDFQSLVAVGTDFPAWARLFPSIRLGNFSGRLGPGECVVGAHVAAWLRVRPGEQVELQMNGVDGPSGGVESRELRIAGAIESGGAEDDQLFIPLLELQRLAGLEGKLSLVELGVPGGRAEIEKTFRELAQAFPGVDVRPIRQIVESQAKVLGMIRGLVISLAGLIMAIIALCVMATMTAIVLERRKDIAVMKSLGAGDGLVMRLFLAEAAVLGLVAGLSGYFVGGFIASAVGRRLVGVGLQWAWWSSPLVCLATVLVSILATLSPVRIVRSIEPAIVLKGA